MKLTEKIPCVRVLNLCIRKVAPKVHLVYFAAVLTEGHGVYALAAGGCLAVGVIGELIGEPI